MIKEKFKEIAIAEKLHKFEMDIGVKFLGVSLDDDLYQWLEDISEQFFQGNKTFCVNSILRNFKNNIEK